MRTTSLALACLAAFATVDASPKDFYTNYFVPNDGFKTVAGVQAACLLDKANHIGTFLVCAPTQLAKDPSNGVLCSDQFFKLLQKKMMQCCTGPVGAMSKPFGAKASVLCKKVAYETFNELNALQAGLEDDKKQGCLKSWKASGSKTCTAVHNKIVNAVYKAFDTNSQGAEKLYLSIANKKFAAHDQTIIAKKFIMLCNPLCADKKITANTKVSDKDVKQCGLKNVRCHNKLVGLQHKLGWSKALQKKKGKKGKKGKK